MSRITFLFFMLTTPLIVKAQFSETMSVELGPQIFVAGPLASNFSLLGRLGLRSEAFRWGSAKIFYDIEGLWDLGNPASSLWMIGAGLGATRTIKGRFQGTVTAGLGHLREHYFLPFEDGRSEVINSLVPKVRLNVTYDLQSWLSLSASASQWSNLGTAIGGSLKIQL